jgi:hypothetical protein
MAKVFLAADSKFPIADHARAQVYGAAGFETLALHGAPSVTVDQNVERVEFPGGLNGYSFQAQGNQVLVKQNGVTIAAVAAQDDGNGTRLAFADGAADLKIVGLGAMTLGGKSFGANSASFAPAELGVGFDASDTSSAGGGGQTLNIGPSNAGGTSDLASGDFSANFAAGNYDYTLSGFAGGDRLAFASGASLSVVNASGTDGQVDISATFTGQIVTVHLTGIAPSADGSIFSVNSFNAVFGPGSLA